MPKPTERDGISNERPIVQSRPKSVPNMEGSVSMAATDIRDEIGLRRSKDDLKRVVMINKKKKS